MEEFLVDESDSVSSEDDRKKKTRVSNYKLVVRDFPNFLKSGPGAC